MADSMNDRRRQNLEETIVLQWLAACSIERRKQRDTRLNLFVPVKLCVALIGQN